MFQKPISQIIEADLQILVDNHEKEGLVLEYKQEVTGTDHEKKEIAKDVSALANTDGGYLIIGIQEEDGKAKSLVGTPKLIGRQPVEEWLGYGVRPQWQTPVENGIRDVIREDGVRGWGQTPFVQEVVK